MQKRTWKLGSVLAGLALCWAGDTMADDVFAPCWRATSGATYQDWSFAVSNNPAIPDVFSNANGTPVASLTLGAFGIGWNASVFSRSGVWDLGQNGSLSILIP